MTYVSSKKKLDDFLFMIYIIF